MQQERSPFQQLADLLEGVEPGQSPINLTLGEPKHAMPAFIGDIIRENETGFRPYPPIRGTDDFRETVASWIENRYQTGDLITAEKHILPLNGTREGLFHAAIGARDWAKTQPGKPTENPAILLPNPFYHSYAAGAHAMDAEAVFLNGTNESNFLPDLDELATETHLLDRTIAFFYASPANPQGSIASLQDWQKLIALARKHKFMIFADECYSEIYRTTPPPGILQACEGNVSNIITFHSLSKRSNLAGLRCGFAAGDADFLTQWTKYRNMAAPQVPLPLLAAGAAAYRDEAHVEENRRLYNEKYEAARRILGTDLDYQQPEGGFFLWLNIRAFGTDIAVTKKLWKQAGVRVIPGSFLARRDRQNINPGEDFIRLALVAPLDETSTALSRLKSCLLDQ
ncbi:aminotransferase class I/II-fold pyridoxal phosphate-dependent enzyme [Cohaesibacter gelatinilyticus]|uniref:Aspartate/methionine/tyrosine aminotransferase n=1 Tax=Cohaesibacter gelatinilyticus TaxID=372072 RepID=A0A285PEA1_9HYPH|nr:aminotransferase class I/II-fold pyridoxal phosphate-dependent enzyme [Cohaesibacter gelatinilyticus]SNZ19758.1 Aspartate/methionine/tyrosine aminotransferase [Cohaesibacter gelatinilyticus]